MLGLLQNAVTMKIDSLLGSNWAFWSILLAILLVVIVWLNFPSRAWRLASKIHGPKPIPIFGNSLEFNVGSNGIFRRIMDLCEEFPHMYKLHLGQSIDVFLHSAEAIEPILSSNKHIDKSFDYSFLENWLGTGLLTSTGRKWHSRRKLLTPAFHFKILEDFLAVFNTQSKKLVEKLRLHENGDEFVINQYITLATLDIILETAMGCSINAQDKTNSEYVEAVNKMGQLIQIRSTRPWVRPEICWWLSGNRAIELKCLKVLHGLSRSTIKSRKETAKRRNTVANSEDEVIGQKKRRAFLDLLIEFSDGGKHLGDSDIQEEVDTFMFEGHDTTSAGISWLIYALGLHQDIQDKVHDELDLIFGDSDRGATSSDLREMKYTEQVVKEAQRLFPSVPFFGRQLYGDVEIMGKMIPKGTSLTVIPYKVHRDPKHFPNPEVFNPDNFLPENCSNRHPYAYIPFSAGPRNCIGQKFALMEEKIVISTLLRNYRIESVTPEKEIRYGAELVLRSENPPVIKLFKREIK